MSAPRVRFHPAAAGDLNTAIDWYEQQGIGLGSALVIFASDGDNDLVVLAIAHRQRRPGYWRDR